MAEQQEDKHYVLLVYVGLAVATFLAFEPIRLNDFVDYDDHHYITENPYVNGGITHSSVAWAFTSSHSGNWHPLTWLSHMLDCELFGLNPVGHHMVSLLFHIANTLLLFWVLKKMTKATWPSAFVAAAFALHPLHVESVVWAAERKDVLSGLFWMLTMTAYVYYAERPSVGRYLLIFLAFCLGLMTKPMLVTLPLVLLLLDYWPLGRFPWPGKSGRQDPSQTEADRLVQCRSSIASPVMEKVPLFVLGAASAVVTWVIQRSWGATAAEGVVPLNVRIGNALISYVSYINKMIYPSRLAVLYPYHNLVLAEVVASFVKLAVVSAVVIYLARRYRYLVTGWLWYFVTLLPVIGLVQIGSQAMADRYTYLPSVGIFIMAAWTAADLFPTWRYRRIALAVAAAVVLVALLVCTRKQVRHWRNSLALFGHTVAVTENNYIMHGNYGVALLKDDRPNEAMEHFKKVIHINPADSQNFITDVSRSFVQRGEFDKAVEILNELLNVGPDKASVQGYLGLVYTQQGKYELAIENFEQALQARPDWPEVLDRLAFAHARMGRFDKAIETAEKALKLADSAGKKNLARQIKERLQSYHASMPEGRH